MARLKNALKHKIQASSLLEVMVALVVMFTVFAISMGLYVNVISSSASLQQTTAIARLETILKQTKAKQEYIDAHIQEEGFNIDKSVKAYPGYENLIVISLKATNLENKVLAEIKAIQIIGK